MNRLGGYKDIQVTRDDTTGWLRAPINKERILTDVLQSGPGLIFSSTSTSRLDRVRTSTGDLGHPQAADHVSQRWYRPGMKAERAKTKLDDYVTASRRYRAELTARDCHCRRRRGVGR
ncbi:hypothetical protein GCM10022254_51190 [Actinomadura meridiana]|uniref:Uncharacterized protein n=1 Tax=Actinomadura meridiana TaxID=559626 RepID=A0ABP8CD99_9ACTN